MHNCNCNHKKPSLAKRILTPIAVMVGTELIKEPAKKIFTDFMKSNMVKTLYIDHICSDLQEFLKENFKHFPSRLSSVCSIENDGIEYEEHDMFTLYDDVDQFTDYAIIEGIPCKLTARSIKIGNDCCATDTFISTININDWPKKLKKIITTAAEEGAKNHRKREAKIFKVIDQHTARFIDAFPRSFDDVFVPKNIQDQITSALDNFTNNADWYIKNKIPYHFGIMLYGSPGTGKTSIAQAIANYVKATMYVVSGDDILKLPAMMDNGRAINTFGLTKNDFNIVLIEDIDCGLSYKSLYARGSRLGSPWATDWDDEEKLDKCQDNNGLATVLNTIDGIGAPRNTIFIFTTNNIEDLDPALIRPGRIDLSLEIKPVCLETFKEFMVHHFGEDVKLPKNLKIREGVTFADIQVKVMSGMSSKDIIDYVRDNTKKYSGTPVKFGEIEPEDEVCDIVVNGVKIPNPYSGYADQYFKKSTISNIRDQKLYEKLKAWMIIYAANKLGTDNVDEISDYISDTLYLWFDECIIADVLKNNPFKKFTEEEK